MANPSRAVVDANVFVRATVESDSEAQSWLDAVDVGRVEAFVPDLVYAEVANAVVRYVRAGEVDGDLAIELLSGIHQIPVLPRPNRSLFGFAFAIAMRENLTAYDAHYLALAEAEDAVLVTADRDLAAAATRGVLLE
jgi:predicted nucleic acid-binding protein